MLLRTGGELPEEVAELNKKSDDELSLMLPFSPSLASRSVAILFLLADRDQKNRAKWFIEELLTYSPRYISDFVKAIPTWPSEYGFLTLALAARDEDVSYKLYPELPYDDITVLDYSKTPRMYAKVNGYVGEFMQDINEYDDDIRPYYVDDSWFNIEIRQFSKAYLHLYSGNSRVCFPITMT